MSTAYHPQTDGQCECTMETLEDMLRACTVDFAGNWDTHLPLVEFPYNNSYHPSVKCASFEALYGRRYRLGKACDNEKKRYDADVRATNIVLQGLPKDIYKLINHNIEAKAIWDNVKMLLAGSELTKEDRESQLYDEFERFKMLPGENINEYYVRFHKLVNDMRNIRMTMPNIQLNSKFVNNMSPEWDRFVTAVKLNKGLKETNHEQLYAYLKQHEKHAAQDRLIIERITPTTNDQLAFHPQFPETSQIDSGHTQTDEILDNLTKQMALLAQSFRATLPQTNNQLRTSSNTRNQATVQDGRIVVQNVQGRQNQNQN
ncbi:retrovirus-related pol polyprotein from transposon TNT 1-94 [Tanacetum coccineum]